jgi:hypothetical protein
VVIVTYTIIHTTHIIALVVAAKIIALVVAAKIIALVVAAKIIALVVAAKIIALVVAVAIYILEVKIIIMAMAVTVATLTTAAVTISSMVHFRISVDKPISKNFIGFDIIDRIGVSTIILVKNKTWQKFGLFNLGDIWLGCKIRDRVEIRVVQLSFNYYLFCSLFNHLSQKYISNSCNVSFR